MTLVIIFSIAIALFGLAFFTRRRFGVLGLGLAAGVLLAQNASRLVSDVLEKNDVPVEPLTYSVAASILLTLLPAALLLIRGPSYLKKLPTIVGSIAFALLGTLLILGPLSVSLPAMDGDVKMVLDFIAKWQGVIVAIAILVAVIDTILLHNIKPPLPKKGKH